ncbi:protein trapped in endoderm-1-like [Bradysia coprophila]|uniref:protein trapped in endoderm-1-like n=1 Tax=Bradysia coprophila TaxID=38358 RepID=UPI00187D8957|nr:protein trapped in endoderm-1-like [Bradysia coprophila]
MTSTGYTCGAILFIIFTMVGFIGNSITTVALLRDRNIRQHSTTAFILSLCISDLIFASFCLPVTAAAFLNSELMHHDPICKLYGSTTYINFAITTFSITAIAVNRSWRLSIHCLTITMVFCRYILIVHNSLYKSMYQKSVVFCQLLVIWILPPALMSIPLTDNWGTISRYKRLCRIMEKDGESIEDLLFVIGIIAPCFIITVLYSCIYYTVRQQLRTVALQTSCPSNSQAVESHLTRMTLLIFVSFVLGCLPLVIEHFWFGGNEVGTTFCSILTIINPFIYATTNRKYRAAYAKLFSDMKFWSLSLFTRETDIK